MLSAKQVFPFTYKPNEPKLTNGLYFPIGTPSFFDPYDVSHRDILTIQIQRYPLSGCWVIPHLLPYFHRNHTAVDAPRDHKMEDSSRTRPLPYSLAGYREKVLNNSYIITLKDDHFNLSDVAGEVL